MIFFYRFLKKYGKQVLAIMTVGLMIAFVLPAGMEGCGDRRNPVIGKIDGKLPIYASDRQIARLEWEALRANPYGMALVDQLLDRSVIPQLEQRPELLVLLVREAQRMGVRPSNDEVQMLLNDVVPGDLTQDERFLLEQAVSHVMMARAAFDRAASVVKVSQPLRDHVIANMFQMITLNLVEFDASQFRDQIPDPTPQQLQEQFEQYADLVAGEPTRENPFGFGYKNPDRVKLQYIAVPRYEVRRVIEQSRDDHRWEVDAHKYYKQNLDQFHRTPLTADPESVPEIHPFHEVRDQIKERLIRTETDRLHTQVRDRIASILGVDWAAYRSAPDGRAPESSLGPHYQSVEYLEKLAEQIQTQFKVLPTVVSLAEKSRGHADLLRLGGLGDARMGQEDVATYVFSSLADFLPSEQRDQAGVLVRLQPSSPLRDDAGGFYLIRVTDAQPARRPDSITEVEDQVRADWKTRRAFELAKERAEQTLAQAKQNGLGAVADSANLRLLTVGPLLNRQGAIVPEYELPGQFTDDFIEEAFRLINTPPPRHDAQPIRLIQLPRPGRAIVAELGEVTALWSPDDENQLAVEIAMASLQDQRRRFARSWFDFDAVAARLNYVPQATPDYDPAPPPRPPARPPLF